MQLEFIIWFALLNKNKNIFLLLMNSSVGLIWKKISWPHCYFNTFLKQWKNKSHTNTLFMCNKQKICIYFEEENLDISILLVRTKEHLLFDSRDFKLILLIYIFADWIQRTIAIFFLKIKKSLSSKLKIVLLSTK